MKTYDELKAERDRILKLFAKNSMKLPRNHQFITHRPTKRTDALAYSEKLDVWIPTHGEDPGADYVLCAPSVAEPPREGLSCLQIIGLWLLAVAIILLIANS